MVFDTAAPGPTTTPIAPPIQFPPPPGEGGTQSLVGVNALPTIPIDGLPATVYIRALFVDNLAWFAPPQNGRGLTYGMFIGGFQLNAGLQPPPDLRAVPLTIGSGITVNMPLRALRKFTSSVALLPPSDAGTVTPADDAEGPLSVAAFQQSDPRNAPVFGGLQGPCVDMKTGPKPVTGLFFGTGDFWFGAQVDDYGLGGVNPEGALVSLVPTPSDAGLIFRIPDRQKITVGTEYTVTVPTILLTGTIPSPGTHPTFQCPVPDAGPG
jgi:hypothetical protein